MTPKAKPKGLWPAGDRRHLGSLVTSVLPSNRLLADRVPFRQEGGGACDKPVWPHPALPPPSAGLLAPRQPCVFPPWRDCPQLTSVLGPGNSWLPSTTLAAPHSVGSIDGLVPGLGPRAGPAGTGVERHTASPCSVSSPFPSPSCQGAVAGSSWAPAGDTTLHFLLEVLATERCGASAPASRPGPACRVRRVPPHCHAPHTCGTHTGAPPGPDERFVPWRHPAARGF